MTDRTARLNRVLALVDLLANNAEGLTPEEMAQALQVTRHMAVQVREAIVATFDLDERLGGHHGGHETTRAPLSSPPQPWAKRRGPDPRGKRQAGPDVDALVRLQRIRAPAGPAGAIDPAALAQVQQAILTGQCLDFDYHADGTDAPTWRRIAVYGLVHGPVTQVLGKVPLHHGQPLSFRLDRMVDVHLSDTPGAPPADWNLDAWQAGQVGLPNDDTDDVVLRVLPPEPSRDRTGGVRPAQVMREGEALVIRFRRGGLREVAEHVFTWGGEMVIEAPDAVRSTLDQRLAIAALARRSTDNPSDS